MIETRRLLFRPWADSDAEALFKYASDPDVGPRAGWPPHQTVEESRKIIRDIFSNGHTWALVLKETGEPIGCMGYYACCESNIPIGENDRGSGESDSHRHRRLLPGTPEAHFVPGSCFPGAKLPQFTPGNLFFLSPGAKPPLFAPGRRRFRVKPGMTKEGLSGKLFPQGLDNGRRDDDLRLFKRRFEA